MAIVNPSGPKSDLRGKVAGLIYSRQSNGTTTVRGVGEQTARSTPGEKRGQRRMKLGHPYLSGVLRNPALRAPYAREAETRKMRTCDLVMSDFLTNPEIVSVDTTKYGGRAGDWLLIVTGDDFKVVRVGVVFRNAADQRVEEGFAVPAQGSNARVWIYTAQRDFAAGEVATIQVTVTDRPGHSTVNGISHLG